MIAKARDWLTANTEPWPLRDHFVITSVYAAMVVIGFGIAGRQL